MSDISARIYHEDGEYEVWVGPADDLASWNVINAFVAGVGRTRNEAVADAVRELDAVVETLQSSPDSERHPAVTEATNVDAVRLAVD